jgi:glycosyltransferase involved in cell wall biosynthesis
LANPDKPLVTVVLPAFNEEVILEENVGILLEYFSSLQDRYRWEVLLINDGSSDGTAAIIERLAEQHDIVTAIHHPVNFGLGQAFKTAFGACHGDYVITLDVDLSYSPEHVERLLTEIQSTPAKLVLASPYMKGGSISNVPTLRRVLSIYANRFLSFFAQGHLSTLTCMVRAYDGKFVRQLDLRSTGMDIMPETVYKAMILRAKIVQIPAHLDWGLQQQPKQPGVSRQSSMRIMRHILATILSGFIFRPFMFFVLPGFLLLALSAYVNVWMLVHIVDVYGGLGADLGVVAKLSAAVAQAYDGYPHTFIVGLLSLMVAIQLISLGILSLQSKTYFEEIFHLGSSIKRDRRDR